MDFVKKPCKHCPFRRDVKPFLTSAFGVELAVTAENPYSTFPCHKTTVPNEEDDDMMVVETSKACAGFLTMQIANGAEIPSGFEPANNIYDTDEMIFVYQNLNR